MASSLQIDLTGVAEQLAELQSEKWIPSAGVDAVVEKLRALQGDEQAAATPFGQAFREVVELTKTMFPGGVKVDVDCDPSDPEHPFVNLIVRVAGKPTEWRKLERKWSVSALAIYSDISECPRLLIYPAHERS